MTTYVVTGASSGIGRACVARLQARGAVVFAGVRREADGEALRQELGPDPEAPAEAWRPWRAYAVMHLWMADAMAAKSAQSPHTNARNKETRYAISA
jgi:NAD(P)-dependent dehydrogenase (short-subunit alcohol dehydrogenase family)